MQKETKIHNPNNYLSAYIEIDLSALSNNYKKISKFVAPSVCATTVKANAYGLGLEEIAKTYERAGIGAISILTENNYFNGEIDHLSLIKQNTRIPILRKDFIIDEYQIFESKVYQADIILLIVSVLSDDQLKHFLKIAEDLQLDVIIETHDEEEIQRAMKLNYPIIGINNRNLKNLKTDVNNSANLFTSISKDFTVIAESGIKSSSDIAMYNELGIFNFLIGESILKSNDYSAFIKTLLNNG